MFPLATTALNEFDQHLKRLKQNERERRELVSFKNVATSKYREEETGSVLETLGYWQTGDVYEGDVHLRTLRTLLSLVDAKGWERYVHGGVI